MLRSGAVTAAAGLLALLLVAACEPAPRGYGVVLWSAGGALPAAAAVEVMEESTIEDRYVVRRAAPEGERGEEPVPVARWRVRVFPEPEPAAAFAEQYMPYAASYAYAARNGLPVRAEASATADIVYKLRDGEVVKVLQREPQPDQVGVYENYWYHLLTEGGVSGYTFGEFLPVFETRGDPYPEALRLRSEDATLDHVLATVWRPGEFRAMVITGRYDLDRFRAEYGLFPDPEAQVFRLVTAAGTREFAYENIERVGDGRYLLRRGDTVGGLRLTVQSASRLAVSYTAAGRAVTRVFVALSSDVAELIAAERARRDQLYADLAARGARWRSTGYGTIELGAERGYRWRGFGGLVPGLLPPGLPGTGRVDFRYEPGPELAGRYDQVITFLFDPPPDGDPAVPAAPAAAAGTVTSGPPAPVTPPAAPVPTGADAGAPADPPPAAEPAAPPVLPAAGEPEPPAAAAETPAAAAPPAAEPPAAPRPAAPKPEVEPAAELTLLAEYDGNGIRLTPAEPDPVTLQVTAVSSTPVVMYFSFFAPAPAISTAGGG